MLPQSAIDLIKHYEGLSLEPYRDPAGHWTIGYGHLIRPNEWWGSITEKEAETLLRVDLADAQEAVTGLTVGRELAAHQYGALVSFVFNLGAGNFRASTLRRCVLAGDDRRAVQEFGRWILAGGKPLNGLIRRRAAEAAMYNG